MITIDFETEAIEGNPLITPPKPIGVAILKDGNGEYTPIGSHSTNLLRNMWEGREDLLFHNAPFDLSVAEKWLGLPFPHWSKIHDTMYLLFLKNPHAASLGLKESAEKHLDLPPEEQDELKEWILANVRGATPKTFGAYICRAPFELVAKYAVGDVDRTKDLFDYLHPHTQLEAYDRERELMPRLVAATRHGIRVARPQLKAAHTAAVQAQERCEQLIRGALGVPTLNPHSGPELAAALDGAGKMDSWVMTPTGRKSTSKPNLLKGINDPELMKLLLYTSAMQTCIGTFIEPWLEKSEADGRLHPNWNQVRSMEGARRGTRTGRLSSDNPNFQNIPNKFDFEIHDDLIAMPVMRRFLLPEEGHVWLKRDWSSQEIRILAHFEEEALCEAYNKDPNLDPHTMVQGLIHQLTGRLFKRKSVKETGFGMIYGMGAKSLAGRIGGTLEDAREVIAAYKLAVPGVEVLQRRTKGIGRTDRPIVTWGGREYYAETPVVTNGQARTFEYKLLNYLIQGSAADQAKQCIIDWHRGADPTSVFMATVHDEINISAEEGLAKQEMAYLKEVMNQPLFDVPMLSEGFTGPNWADLKETL